MINSYLKLTMLIKFIHHLIIVCVLLFSSAFIFANQVEDCVTHFEVCEKEALNNNSVSQYNLGMAYYEGKGVEQDYKQAFYWLERAALQKHVLAEIVIAIMYYRGHGVEKNYFMLYAWVLKSYFNQKKLSNIHRNKIKKILTRSEKNKLKKFLVQQCDFIKNYKYDNVKCSFNNIKKYL